MLVKTFISHIKHKSLHIEIVDKNFDSLLFDGTIGEYKTSLAKDKCDNLSIEEICPGFNDSLMIVYNSINIHNSSAYGKCKGVIK